MQSLFFKKPFAGKSKWFFILLIMDACHILVLFYFSDSKLIPGDGRQRSVEVNFNHLFALNKTAVFIPKAKKNLPPLCVD